MGVNHMLAASARQFSSMITTPLSKRSAARSPASEPTDEAPTVAEIAAAARRSCERSSFDDDGAYFEFLIDRAVAAATPEESP